MRKGIFLPIILLVGILAFSLWNSAVISQNTDRWLTQLQQADTLAQAKNWDTAMDALSESYEDWSHHKPWLHIVVKHDIVNGTEAMYHRAMAFAAETEPSEFRAELADLQDQLRLLAETEQFNLENIL